jgi:hypothetical protein
MEATTEISISYNSKASGMFSHECVGGPENGSSKLAWWRAARWNESFFTSHGWKRGSFDYNQECTEHAFKIVNSRLAWRATRCAEHTFTGVYSKFAWRATRLCLVMHRNAQQNKTQECHGAHYILCQSQEWRQLMVIPVVETSAGSQECVGGTCKVL